MVIKAKVKVKSLIIKEDVDSSFYISFLPVETQSVNGEIFVKVVTENEVKNISLTDKIFDVIKVSKNVFDFISAHSKENFSIELDCKKSELSYLKEVSLVYG